MSDIIQFWLHLSSRRKTQYIFLIFFMIFASLAEMLTIGAVIPFLSVLVDPQIIYEHEIIQPLILFLDVSDPQQLIYPIVVCFIIIVTIAGFFRVSLIYFSTKLSFLTGVDISVDIYNRTLNQDYLTHINRNSSQVTSAIVVKTNLVIGGIVGPILNLIGSSVTSIGILTILIYINPIISFCVFIGFASVYILISLFLSRIVKRNSETISSQATLMVQHLQEGLGGIKNIILNNSHNFFLARYNKSVSLKQKASAQNTFSAYCPKPILEILGMVLIAVFAYRLSLADNKIQSAIPILGLLTLAAQRLLPAIQQSYAAYISVKSNKSVLKDIIFFLNIKIPEHSKSSSIGFEEEILVSDVSFRYSEKEPWILQNVNFSLKKNTTIGFFGTTGSGKSTLINIIMGLLDPSEGYIAIDGETITDKNKQRWFKCIAHVPQDIFLVDGTIESNIAYGIPEDEIDHLWLREVTKKANILNFIEASKDGFKTKVGESGLKISGGQRQRLGIARALYKKCDILILDEATSALDNETERKIMHEINALSSEMTILIVAHRLSTLENCHELIDMSNW
ncbi:ABC transporter ATP-binding protein/permease [Amylibacter sp.]|nr:ABC transporter ATP-binding protein/permease [Amylibacter sp.]